jgi:hypothetical protein
MHCYKSPFDLLSRDLGSKVTGERVHVFVPIKDGDPWKEVGFTLETKDEENGDSVLYLELDIQEPRPDRSILVVIEDREGQLIESAGLLEVDGKLVPMGNVRGW